MRLQNLNQKLMFFWLGSILLSLSLLAVVFFFLNNELHDDIVRQKIDDAFIEFDKILEERRGYLAHNTRLLTERADIIASLNLMYKYQDPLAYQPLIFDPEKISLAQELLKLLNSLKVDIIAAYDAHRRLISFAYLDGQGQSKTGYLSYRNGASVYHVSDGGVDDFTELKALPPEIHVMAEFEPEDSKEGHVDVHNGSIVMDIRVPVMRQVHDIPAQRIGSIVMLDRFEQAFARDMSNKTGLGFMFSLNREGYNWVSSIADDDAGKSQSGDLIDLNRIDLGTGITGLKNWRWLSQGGVSYGVADYPLDSGAGNIRFVFLDMEDTSRLEFTVFKKAIFLVLMINILLIIPGGVYFLRHTILRPVRNLVTGIDSVRKGRYQQIASSSSHDELAFLTNTFNEMSQAIQLREDDLRKLSLAVEQSPVSIIITSLDGDIEYVNPAFTTMMGYSVDEIIGKNTHILQGGETSPEVYQQLWKAITQGQSWSGVFHNRCKDGRLIWQSAKILPIKDVDGKIINYMALSEDVTQSKSSRDQLTLQAAALQAAADGIVITDKAGTIQWVNPAYERMTGYPMVEAVGRNPRILKSGRHDQSFYRDMWETILAGKTWQGEIYNQRKNGDLYLEEEAITPVFDEAGEITHFVAVKRDITEQRQQEEMFHRSQKMDALGKLTGGIAHDYNNMLGVVLGYAEMLKMRIKDDPKLEKYVEEIQHAGERGAKLTRKLLSFSRSQLSEATSININTLLRDNQLMLEKTLTARIELIFNLADDLCTSYMDSSDFEDALLNMCINSMHAIEGNGQITLGTSNIELGTDDAQELKLEPGDYVLFTLTDTGFGMDESTQKQIFDPFFSSKGEKGTGLGLSQVYGFVQRTKGAIRVASKPGHGTRFDLYFPCDHTQATVPDSEQDNHGVIDLTGHETILVVDDEQGLRDLTQEMLIAQGYHVLCAKDAQQALAILEKETVHLVLSDVVMPGMDGYQLATMIERMYPSIKIQLASGYSDERHRGMNHDELHQNLLHKPYRFNSLLTRIRDLLDDAGRVS